MPDLHYSGMDGLKKACEQTRNYGPCTGMYNEILYDRWTGTIWIICQAVGHLTQPHDEEVIRVYAGRDRLSMHKLVAIISRCVQEYDCWVTGEADEDGWDNFHAWLGRPFFDVEDGFDPEVGNDKERAVLTMEEKRITMGAPQAANPMPDLHGLKMDGLREASMRTRNYSPLAAGEAVHRPATQFNQMEEIKMNRYVQMKQRQQEEFNTFLGLKPTDADKIFYYNPGGGFYCWEDYTHLKEMVDRFDAELEAAISDDKTGDGFIYEMFLYELSNRGYGSTGTINPTLDALGYTLDYILDYARLRHGLNRAMERFGRRLCEIL